MMGRRICPLCEHYDTCKYWEVLLGFFNADKLFFALDGITDEVKKWRQRFARFCVHFKLDEPQLEYLIKCGLDFIFHDYVYYPSELQSPLLKSPPEESA